MPLISVNATPGAFYPDSKYRLIKAFTAASAEAESLPAGTERQCVVIWNDTAEVYMGGEPAGQFASALFVTFTVADGVLDPTRRAAFVAAVQSAAEDEAGERRVFTSVVFADVPEGRWGIGGGIMRLPEMAAASGMQHLSAIVSGSRGERTNGRSRG